jgi:hypothetical protein
MRALAQVVVGGRALRLDLAGLAFPHNLAASFASDAPAALAGAFFGAAALAIVMTFPLCFFTGALQAPPG